VARKPAASIGSVPTQSRLPTFGALPSEVRWRPWAGSVYGLVVWLGFELGIAPVLGLSQAKRVRAVDRVALAADHLLFGLVLTATRPNGRS
jgi:hypothetical protein